MFAYSEREKTHAARHLPDDVPADIKSRRLQEIIATFRDGQLRQNEAEIGRTQLVRLLQHLDRLMTLCSLLQRSTLDLKSATVLWHLLCDQ